VDMAAVGRHMDACARLSGDARLPARLRDLRNSVMYGVLAKNLHFAVRDLEGYPPAPLAVFSRGRRTPLAVVAVGSGSARGQPGSLEALEALNGAAEPGAKLLLVVLHRPDEALREAAAAAGVDVHVVFRQLAEPAAPEEVAAWLDAEELQG